MSTNLYAMLGAAVAHTGSRVSLLFFFLRVYHGVSTPKDFTYQGVALVVAWAQ